MMQKAVEKFQTIHPLGLKSPRIDRAKYDQMRAAILDLLSEKESVSFFDGMQIIRSRLEGKFDGKINWYYTIVKLDLEARGELIRLPGTGKQMMRKG